MRDGFLGICSSGISHREENALKRILAVLVAVAALAAIAAGCSQDGTPAPAEPTPTKDTAEYYSTWTKQDWENATPEERQLACIFMVEEAVASQGADEEVVQSIIDQAEESMTPEAYTAIEDAITAYYDKSGDNANLQDALHDVIGTIEKYVAIG